MSDPISIETGTARLIAELEASLSAGGQVNAELSELRLSVDAWRKAARAAARNLKRPVQTITADGRVWAMLRDWPANDEERLVQRKRIRDAANAASFH